MLFRSWLGSRDYPIERNFMLGLGLTRHPCLVATSSLLVYTEFYCFTVPMQESCAYFTHILNSIPYTYFFFLFFLFLYISLFFISLCLEHRCGLEKNEKKVKKARITQGSDTRMGQNARQKLPETQCASVPGGNNLADQGGEQVSRTIYLYNGGIQDCLRRFRSMWESAWFSNCPSPTGSTAAFC